MKRWVVVDLARIHGLSHKTVRAALDGTPTVTYLTNISEEHDSVHLNVSEMVGGDVCAGAQPGRALLAKLMAACAGSPATAEPVFLDFRSIDLATASFLRESVLGLRTLLRGRKANYYPVVTNANALIVDELEILLAPGRDALLACTLEINGSVTNVHLLGRLEDKQQRVFEMVEKRRETDAGELQQDFGASEGVQQTAWNNRLAALAGLGLIVEISRGRAKRYRALLEGD